MYWDDWKLVQDSRFCYKFLNPLNALLNPIRHLLALVGARHIVTLAGLGLRPFLGNGSEVPVFLKQL